MTIALSAINARSACDELRDKVQADHMSVHPEQLVIPELRLRGIDPKTIRSLAESISEVGLLEPIGVKHAGANTNRYIVIYGARRAMACQLLHREAMAEATDPNKDQEVFRYTQVQVLRFRHEIPDEVCRELEIRENLDRKELTSNQRRAHILQLAAITQVREKKRKHIEAHKGDGVSDEFRQKLQNKNGRPKGSSNPVKEEIAKSLGISRPTLDSRVKAASKIVKEDLDLDKTPPEKLEAAARVILDTPPARRGPPPKGEPFSVGEETRKGRRLHLNLYPLDAVAFADWMRLRHPASFSLDDIRAYRDALAELVKELEA